jgi:alginate production protein
MPWHLGGIGMRRPLTLKCSPWLVAALLPVVLLPTGPAAAGVPEYMKINAAVGLGVEVKGTVNADGLLEADDIEALPEPRSPKLRGALEKADAAAGYVVMFGRRIALTADTEYAAIDAAGLKPGRRVEVSCRVRDGLWSAKAIEGGDIKDSDKVKGTITEMWADGVAPDTLSLDGLLILLDEQTDVADAGRSDAARQKYLYGHLGVEDAAALSRGHALADGRLGLRVQYRQDLVDKHDLDLTSAYDSDIRSTRPELKVTAFGFASQALRGMVEMRLRRTYVVDSDLGLDHEDTEIQLRQAYVLWRDIARRDMGLSVGRQKLKEERQWLWDEYLTAARFHHYGSDLLTWQVTWIDPIDPIKDSFATWRDLFVAVDVHADEDNVMSAYVLRRWDSDETRNREPVWWGARYLGEPLRRTMAWADVAIMRGTDKHTPLRAWAFDVGGTWQPPRLPWNLTLIGGYAFGSGDAHDSPDTDGEFRQTGYEDNSMRFSGVTGVKYYGALMDPELSNLAVVTLGIGVRPLHDLSLEILYHGYRQDWAEDDLRGSLVDPPPPPHGVSTNVGWETDLVVAARNIWGAARAAWTIGVFEPGDAYAPRRDRAVLNKIEIKVEI